MFLWEKESEQYYDEEAEQFLADRYIMGTCPKCGNASAYGDQCEKCGTSLSPTELINPHSTLTNSKPVVRKTKHWYLPMGIYQAWIDEWINKGFDDDKFQHKPDAWRTHVMGQCNAWIEGGLRDRAMTRDLDWGVQVPLEGADGKVLYVWLDAPIGYISATKIWAEQNQKDWKAYWQDEDTALVHFIGKDNIVFHCIIFPILLHAHGGYILPMNVPANQFLNLESDKLSTSRNWAIWLADYLKDFPNQQDSLRYMLTSTAPENKDSDFTWKDFQARHNNELASIFGNFVHRTLVLLHKYKNGILPSLSQPKVTEPIYEQMSIIKNELIEHLEAFRFREGQITFMQLARLGNKYLTDKEPWKLIKTNQAQALDTLFVCIQVCASLAIYGEPFLPHTCKKLRDMLNISTCSWEKEFFLEAGHRIEKPTMLFQKIDDETIEVQIEKLKKNSKASR